MRRIGFITWAIASFVVVAITQPVPGNGQTPPSSQDSDSNIIHSKLERLDSKPLLRASFSPPLKTTIPNLSSHLQAQTSQNSNWILEFPVYPIYNTCGDALTARLPLVLTGSSFSGQMGWSWGGKQYYSPISGSITGNNVELSFSSPEAVVYPYRLNGSINEKGEFVGTARIVDGPCGGKSGPFTLRPESRTPQTIEEKRAFRKSDQQVAAELAALRERGKREGWTFEIGDSQAFRILLELLAGTRIPDNFRPNVINILDILTRLIQDATRNNPTPAPPQPVPPQPVPPRPIPNPNQLPNHFDAREWGVVPEIRDQKDCGSCWAFAAVSAQEIAYSSLYKQPSGSLNLSEQQLLSCNRNNFSCSGGFISDQDSDYRYESGLVGEQAYPYEERKSTCRNFSRPGSGNLFDIKAFQFIGVNDDPGSPANITKIKQAIYAYGVVWAGVHSDEAFQAYKGTGVFNACRNGKPNHAINIIGWDDAGGYWIVRNSWNNDWGENGYMKIKYGCSQIGISAAIPKLPVLADCNGGNCQPRNPSSPPWLGGNAPNPVPPTPTPPTSVPPTSVPPVSNPNPPNNIPPGYNW